MKHERVRTTVRLDPAVLGELRAKSALTGVAVTDLVNEAVVNWLREDDEDLAAFEERSGEPVITTEELLNGLQADRNIQSR
ncbi:MAG TPA: ribbon-helix-helix domain-containing protein [Myxococcota bacterium]|nr:ribbon-helix-helix domain-containing protein [Myxococcota bacterium]